MKRILVLNFFPAFLPPSSGGELRYFNMYSRLSAFFDITLLSPTYADHKFEIVTHSDTFREYRIPKEDSIHTRLSRKLISEGVCSEVSALVCALSSAYPNDYHRYYFELYAGADIIVHDSPYMVEYDMLWGLDDKPRAYNSHNVEYLLIKQLYRGEKANTYLDYVFDLENEAASQSDILFAISEDEKKAFAELYDVSPGKISLAPNGIEPAEQTFVARRGKKSVLFIGSQHPPNVEAVNFIIQNVAPRCSELDFLIVGSCCNPFKKKKSWPKNIRLLGTVDESKKRELFANSDIAVNPVLSGAGTNLKTLEFLSAGLPLISSDTGVRGLGLRDGEHYVKAQEGNFAEKLRDLVADDPLRENISRLGRLYINEHYSWKETVQTVRDRLDGLVCGKRRSRRRILLLNDFCASSPASGGEMRINRLYSGLSHYHDIVLLCFNTSSQIARSQITQTFTELSFPKMQEHITEEQRVNRLSRISAADIVSSYMCVHNWLYLAALKAVYTAVDLVVLVHPYMVLALNTLRGKPLIYESLNFESGLKRDLLKDHPLFETLIAQVEQVEQAACRQSALLLGVSREDISQITAFSEITADNAFVIGNGGDIKNADSFADTHEGIKKSLCGHQSLLFVGSRHIPNISALHFIIRNLAPALPHCIFLIIGTVCDAFRSKDMPKNVLLFGKLDEAYKEALLRIADVAINPMSEGSGSNLKLAEYLAYKLPTVTTEMGARGYDVRDGQEVMISSLPDFVGKIAYLLGNDELRRTLSERGYAYANRELGWSTLADDYCSILDRTVFKKG